MKNLHHLLHHPLPLLLLPDPIGQGGGDPGGHHHQADHHDRHDRHHHHQALPGGHHHQADPRRLGEHQPVAGHHRLPHVELFGLRALFFGFHRLIAQVQLGGQCHSLRLAGLDQLWPQTTL